MAHLDEASQRQLEVAYTNWKDELERRELELDRAGLQLVNDKWLGFVEREMARVESTRDQMFQSLSKKAREELKTRERELERRVDADLAKDARYTSLREQVESDKKRIQRGKKALQAMNSRTWSEMGKDFVDSVKNLWQRAARGKASDAPLKELADEQKVLQQSVLTLEVGVHKKEDQVINLKRLAIAEEHAHFLQERIDAARLMSDNHTKEVVNALNELTAIVTETGNGIQAARKAIHEHISVINSSLAELAETVQAYSDNVHTLLSQYEAVAVDYMHKQGTDEFAKTVLAALQTLPKMQKPVLAESRCGLAKKSDYRKMKYDSSSELYDAGYGSDEEDAANRGKTYPFQPEVYQQAVAKMSEPTWGMNLLMYWGPGSGKTCAILLGLQKMAQHYMRHPPHDENGKEVEAGALILMQNTAGLEEYYGELNKFCIDKQSMKGLRVMQVKRTGLSDDDDDDAPPPPRMNLRSSTRKGLRSSTHAKTTSTGAALYKNSHEWCFVTKDLKRTVLRVIVHKMSSPLLVATEWRKGPLHKKQSPPEGSPRWEVPRVGCVIVDEAHNLFDTSQMKTSQHSNHAVKFIQQMVARPDIRRLLSTGTPVADSNSFAKLMTLLDFLRHPAPSGAAVLAAAPNCNQVMESTDADRRMTDLDELEAAARASKQVDRSAINELLKRYAGERAARKQWFHVLPNGDYAWLPCAEHTFKQMLYGYVSYVNMEADATAFPQFGVQWNGRRYPNGMVYTKFRAVDSQGEDVSSLAETAGKNGGKGKKKAAKLTATARFDLSSFESTGKGASVLVIDIPTHKSNMQAEEARVTVQGQIGKHFTQIKDVPYKWYALRHVLQTNPAVKHFVFLEKQNDDLLRKFCAWFEKAMRDDSSIDAANPMKKPELFQLPAMYNDRWTDAQVEEHLIALNKGRTRVYRYMILGDELTIKSSLRFFNATCNKGGDQIAVVMGLSTVKEQVTISDTNFVHLLQAPTSATMLNQVVRRVARRCSMSNIEPISKWIVTIVIYHTSESPKEAAWLVKSMGAANTPVELAYRALQSTAVDCALYAAMTGVACDEHTAQQTQTYCMFPRGGPQRLIKMVSGPHGTMYSEPDCINDEGIPGGLVEYDVWDEILHQLLTNSKRYKAQPIPPEAAPDLIRRFPDTVKSTLRTGVWVEDGQRPKLTFARDVPPEVLARWIDATPDSVGGSVLFLLQTKRDGADPQVVKMLHKKAKVYIARVDADLSMHDSLERQVAALQMMRDQQGADLQALKSASLRVDTAGRAAQQLVERNARYI